jgi:hypothetical protein
VVLIRDSKVYTCSGKRSILNLYILDQNHTASNYSGFILPFS